MSSLIQPEQRQLYVIFSKHRANCIFNSYAALVISEKGSAEVAQGLSPVQTKWRLMRYATAFNALRQDQDRRERQTTNSPVTANNRVTIHIPQLPKRAYGVSPVVGVTFAASTPDSN